MTNKNGYQPIKTSRDNVTPPNTGSCVRAKITAGMDIQEDVLKLRIENEKLKEGKLKLEAKVRTLEIEQNYCLQNCSKITELEKQNKKLQEELEFYRAYNAEKKEYEFSGFKKILWIIKAKKVFKDIITWAEWKGPGCPNFNNIKKNVEKILKKEG